EAPIQAWAAAQGYTNDQPPTETDTLYRPEDQPMVNFISPSQGGSITIQPYTFQVSASSVRGVRRVEYFLNDISIGSITVAPFSLPFNPTPKTPNGSYTLKAVASDDLGNEGRATIQVTLSTDRTGEWGVLWSNMTNGKSYINDELPPELSLEITNPLQLKKIDYYLEAPGGSKSFIGFENVVNRSVVTHSWSPPSQAGIYSLSVVVTDAFNESYAQPALTFTVQN
ncbi:MAG: Ig-like domain-containing protein, partial [Patescibacteria group bacterium]